MTIKGFK